MKATFVFPVLLAVASAAFAQARPAGGELVSVKKIWDKAPHNAFTDLARYQGRWFCVFREGKSHVSPDGALRVLTSNDGEEWSSAALIQDPNADLRDAKISVTAEGELMLSGAAALHQPAAAHHLSVAWFSKDGTEWSAPATIGDPNYWLWRVTWRRNTAYSVGYRTVAPEGVRLYRSRDGRHFETLVPELYRKGSPNEATLCFLPDDSALCLMRRDGRPSSALLGTARSPYTEWDWKDLGMRVGGPNLVRLPDGRFVAAGRLYDGGPHTSLLWLDEKAGRLTEFLKLPSGGDTSYPGLVWDRGLLWVSYYSSHEGKASIYLAKVRLDRP